jgi:hypothetical protein
VLTWGGLPFDLPERPGGAEGYGLQPLEHACLGLNVHAPTFVPALRQPVTLLPTRSPYSPTPSASTYPSLRRLGVLYFNARSIVNKLSEIHDLLYAGTHDIICISETWLSARVTDGLIDPSSQYSIYRTDRKSAHPSGGVLIAVRNSLQSSPGCVWDPTGDGSFEAVSCHVELSSERINIVCAYNAPNSYNDDYVASIAKLRSLCALGGGCILAGDFNLPRISWAEHIVPSDVKSQLLYTFAMDLGFCQLVDTATRQHNILDLIFSNDPLLVTELSVNASFGTSDHESISFAVHDVAAPTEPSSPSISLRWAKADWSKFSQYIAGTDWAALFSTCHDSEESWSAFASVLNHGINLYVPTTAYNAAKLKKLRSKNVCNLRRKKALLWRRKRITPTPEANNSYKRVCLLLKRAVIKDASEREMRIIMSGDLGLFYKHVNNRQIHKSGIAPLVDAVGCLCTNDLDKANILNDAFIGVGTFDNGSLPPCSTANGVFRSLDTVYFSQEFVLRIIRKLKTNSAAGPDGFPSILFKELSRYLTAPIAFLFNLIMQFGAVPTPWKLATVTPIFKKGCASQALNYRPISITSICSKMFEAGIKDAILSYASERELLGPHQHGFLSRHSTCTNLLEAMNDWTNNLDSKSDTLIAYVDYAKAFDSVSIPKLMHKLHLMGIRGLVGSCINSFLTDRQQRVKVGKELSTLQTVRSGVPQGSVLGPILFVLFINDLTVGMPNNSISKLFADDVKSYVRISCSADVAVFNASLGSLTDWSDSWQLPISTIKSNWMRLSNVNAVDYGTNFTLAGSLIDEVHDVRDLGVIFDDDLSFTTHINATVGKARQRLFLIRKSFLTKNVSALILAFKTYILPILDYCSPVWCPSQLPDINKLESVQRGFTKRLDGYEGLTYPQRLTRSGLCSLELRRLRADLMYCYKILRGHVEVHGMLALDNRNATRGHSWKLRATKPRLNTRRDFFEFRVVKVWNALASSTVCAPTIAAFKLMLAKEDLSPHLILDL